MYIYKLNLKKVNTNTDEVLVNTEEYYRYFSQVEDFYSDFIDGNTNIKLDDYFVEHLNEKGFCELKISTFSRDYFVTVTKIYLN